MGRGSTRYHTLHGPSQALGVGAWYAGAERGGAIGGAAPPVGLFWSIRGYRSYDWDWVGYQGNGDLSPHKPAGSRHRID